MNILLVEDYQDLLHAIAESLQRLDHRVTGLRTAEEVDAVLAHQRTDLALVDLNLPREDGLSLIKRLRQAHPEMGIIIISARNTPYLGLVHQRFFAEQALEDWLSQLLAGLAKVGAAELDEGWVLNR